jgi:hypothetical protein
MQFHFWSFAKYYNIVATYCRKIGVTDLNETIMAMQHKNVKVTKKVLKKSTHYIEELACEKHISSLEHE